MRMTLHGGGRPFEQIMRSASAGRIVHALILHGEAGTGRHTAAFQLASALLCRGNDKPCGVCPGCQRVAAHTHPDLHILSPEEDKKSISVEQVRKLVADVAQRPFEGGARVIVIDVADQMTDSAQNALLKTLEEPGSDTAFLLVTNQLSSLLPTIRSRCRAVRFSPLSVSECRDVILSRGASEASAPVAAALARGSVGRALELAEKGTDAFLPVLDSLTDLARGRLNQAIAPLTDKKLNRNEVLDFMETWARDKLMWDEGSPTYLPPEQAKFAEIALPGGALLKAVGNIRRRLASNVSLEHAIRSAYIEITEEQTKWQP